MLFRSPRDPFTATPQVETPSHLYPGTGWSEANGPLCSLIPPPSRGLSFGLGLEDVGFNSELQN